MPRNHHVAPRSLAVLLLLALASFGLWSWLGRASGPDEPAPPRELAAPHDAPKIEAPPPLDAGERTRAESAPLESSPEIAITARFRDEAGAAASEVELVLKRWQRGEGDRRFEPLPELEVRCDVHGVLALRVPHLPRLLLHLELRDARYAAERWRWQDLAVGAREDLGDIVLARGAIVRGRVLDRAGVPIAAGWSIDARRTKPETVQVVSLSLEASTTDGTFEMRGFSVGTWRIEARLPTYSIASAEIELQAGETREVVLQQTSARDARSEIVLRVQRPHQLFPAPERQHMKLLLPGGEVRAPDPAQRMFDDSDPLFSGLSPGMHRVSIEDPRYEPWSTEVEVPRTEPVVAKLRGSSAIDVRVIDGASGQAIERYALELCETRYRIATGGEAQSGSGSGLDRSREMQTHPDGRTALEGLVACTLRYALHAEGFAPQWLEVKDLQAGERRSVLVELSAGAVLEGRVRSAAGIAVAGALVAIFAPAAEGDHAEAELLPARTMRSDAARLRAEIARTTTDAEGRFRFEKLQPGTRILTATSCGSGREREIPMDPSHPHVKLEGVEIPMQGTATPVELVLPNSAVLSGRVRVPEGRTPEGLTLELVRELPPPSESSARRFSPPAPLEHPLAADGRFRFEGLAAGSFRVRLSLPSMAPAPAGELRQARVQGAARAIDRVELVAGVTTEREIDLVPHFPAQVRVQFAVDRPEHVQKMQLLLRPAQDAPGEDKRVPIQTAMFDAQGRAEHPFVHPGRHHIDLFANGGLWTHIAATDVELGPGASHELHVNIALLEGWISVRNAGGSPLRDAEIGFGSLALPGAPALGWGALDLDGEGRARVALPAGRYRVQHWQEGSNKRQVAELDWPGGSVVEAQLAEPPAPSGTDR
ncbi:MAG: carboxypeptidase regulatory-like domain-containing protein [Planctomycetes bacterium]|nr:carboxypeptidase regulatory-like domain-containing protein [Planctomycetota bacterium]